MQFFVQEFVNGLSLGIAYAVMGVGLTFVFGILRIMTFAHGEFYALGAYGAIAAISLLHVSYWGAVPLSLVFAWVVASVTYFVAIRPTMRGRDEHGMAALITTYGLSLVGVNAFQLIAGTQPRFINSGIQGVLIVHGVVIPQQRVLVAAVGIVLLVATGVLLKFTRPGRVLRAVAQNQVGAALVGIRVRRVQLVAFALGSTLAALAGVLVAPTGLVTPEIGQNILIKCFVVVILGGLGSVPGAAIAGLLLGLVEALGGAYVNSQWTDAYGLALMLVILLARPSGLSGVGVATVGRGFMLPQFVVRLAGRATR